MVSHRPLFIGAAFLIVSTSLVVVFCGVMIDNITTDIEQNSDKISDKVIQDQIDMETAIYRDLTMGSFAFGSIIGYLMICLGFYSLSAYKTAKLDLLAGDYDSALKNFKRAGDKEMIVNVTELKQNQMQSMQQPPQSSGPNINDSAIAGDLNLIINQINSQTSNSKPFTSPSILTMISIIATISSIGLRLISG